MVRADDGTWSEIRVITDEDLHAYSAFIRGGTATEVSNAYYAELVAQGYGSHFLN